MFDPDKITLYFKLVALIVVMGLPFAVLLLMGYELVLYIAARSKSESEQVTKYRKNVLLNIKEYKSRVKWIF